MKFRSLNMLLSTAVATVVAGSLGMQTAAAASAPSVDHLALAAPVTVDKVDPRLKTASGAVEVVVQLSGTPVALAAGTMSSAQQSTYSGSLRSSQSTTMGKIAALGGTELARVRVAYNALIVRVDASKIGSIASMTEVMSVRPVGEYELDLTQTVPYVGASAAQGAGYDGTGVRIAVLDSGIDYMHKNLGGPGTQSAYDTCAAQAAATPTGICATYFGPGAPKVVGGYDFVGENWPTFGDRTEDPNPIDAGSGAGHGTHVADIAAGRSTDGSHVGVAPGAELYAVKVCSSVSSSCNGIALLKGMDFALDPNGDGSIKDAVDVVNMSLGSSYGQIEDDLSAASANAVKAGVVVVASAGNSGDKPYVTGSPAATPEVISVAQTAMPNAVAFPLVVTGITPSIITNTNTVDWAPIGAGFSGAVVRLGRGCPGDTYFNGNSPAGKVALIDRGTCSVSLKVDGATKAGAVAVIIANNVAGDPPSFSYGGGDLPLAPTVIITLSDGNRIKSALGATGVNAAVVASMSSANSIPLTGSMAVTSSRGPNYSFTAIKPEIGAPGASVSAQYGTGDGMTAFGGTSGAAPVVTGTAALMLQKFPNRKPAEIKAALMNSAETVIYTNPATLPGVLAPISRIGAGEVRVDRALAATTAAWDGSSKAAALSFGYLAVDQNRTVCRSVNVRNYSGNPRTYSVSASFRYASDGASGAVTPSAPSSVAVTAGGDASFEVCLALDAAKLPNWSLNGGSQGGNGPLLQSHEFDGFVTIQDGEDTVSLPWHILPHKAAAVSAVGKQVVLKSGSGSLTLANKSMVRDGGVDVFALTGTSGRIPASQLPKTGDNYAVIDLKAIGVRYLSATESGVAGGVVQFAVNTYGERAHPAYPAEFDVYVDTDSDGNDDYVLYTAELNGFAATGQVVVYVANLLTGSATAYFFADASLNSGNIILTAPLSALGLAQGSKFTFGVYAFDNYFTGGLTDAVENMTFTAGAPRYDAGLGGTVTRGTSATLPVQAVPGGATASPSQSGFLLMYRDGAPGREAEAIPVQ
jgi:subtilisin family serine protease